MQTTNALQDTWEYIIYTLSVALHPSVLKSVWAVLFIMFSFMFDISQGAALFALFILVLIDFVTGVASAKFLGEPIRSSKIKHTAIKITAYFTVIAAAHLAEHGLSHYIAFLDETVLSFFMLTEFISLLENMGRIGIATPKKLLNQLVDTKNKL